MLFALGRLAVGTNARHAASADTYEVDGIKFLVYPGHIALVDVMFVHEPGEIVRKHTYNQRCTMLRASGSGISCPLKLGGPRCIRLARMQVEEARAEFGSMTWPRKVKEDENNLQMQLGYKAVLKTPILWAMAQ
jgi:hypothetical protein